MAPGVTRKPVERTTRPLWAGEELGYPNLIPGGAQLSAIGFYAEDSFVVTVGSAGAAKAATTVPVTALSKPLPSGAKLVFDDLAGVVVEVEGAVSAAATTIPLATATTGKIPDNTLLDFGGTKFARVNGAMAAGVTSLTVDAIPTALADGNTATYPGATRQVVLSAPAPAGSTSLTVQALPEALSAAETARYEGDGTKKKVVPSGTLLARTLAQETAGIGFRQAIVADASDADIELYILARDVPDADENSDCSLYRHRRIVKYNYLPSFPVELMPKLRANYDCVLGVA